MALSIGGCSADGIGDSAIKFIQENNPDFSDNFIMKVKNGYIPTISNDVTLGTALDGYLSNTSWQFNVVDNDRIVECDGNGTLYDKDVDAIILNETYRANLEELEDYIDFASETNVVYQTVYYTDKENEALVVSDITSEPFNILYFRNDTYGDCR